MGILDFFFSSPLPPLPDGGGNQPKMQDPNNPSSNPQAQTSTTPAPNPLEEKMAKDLEKLKAFENKIKASSSLVEKPKVEEKKGQFTKHEQVALSIRNPFRGV